MCGGGCLAAEDESCLRLQEPLVSSPVVFCQRSRARCRCRRRRRGWVAAPTTPSAVPEAPSTSAARNCATARPTAPATPTRTPRTAPTASRAQFSLRPMVEIENQQTKNVHCRRLLNIFVFREKCSNSKKLNFLNRASFKIYWHACFFSSGWIFFSRLATCVHRGVRRRGIPVRRPQMHGQDEAVRRNHRLRRPIRRSQLRRATAKQWVPFFLILHNQKFSQFRFLYFLQFKEMSLITSTCSD